MSQYSQEISQYSQPSGLQRFKKKLQHSSFLENIANFLRTLILENIFEQLLLKLTQGQIYWWVSITCPYNK